jgi:nitroreductase
VSVEAIDRILHVAMAAPAAVNMEPWEIIIITDNKSLRKAKRNGSRLV